MKRRHLPFLFLLVIFLIEFDLSYRHIFLFSVDVKITIENKCNLFVFFNIGSVCTCIRALFSSIFFPVKCRPEREKESRKKKKLDAIIDSIIPSFIVTKCYPCIDKEWI